MLLFLYAKIPRPSATFTHHPHKENIEFECVCRCVEFSAVWDFFVIVAGPDQFTLVQSLI